MLHFDKNVLSELIHSSEMFHISLKGENEQQLITQNISIELILRESSSRLQVWVNTFPQKMMNG